MTTARINAPAKVNLTLHVVGKRKDGYHELDSLVVFADVADQLAATIAPDLRLSVSGPFAQGVPVDSSNLVLRAAEALRRARGVQDGAHITLEKHLPNQAGIGGGSADAAAAFALLAELWQVAPLPADAPEVVTLGADVPVCMRTPEPTRMMGIGERLLPAAPLPQCALVLVKAPTTVPTGGVFQGLASATNPQMDPLPPGLDFEGFANWLNRQRNDLLPPARLVAPDIDLSLQKLKAMPAVKAVGMSGSGATCYGLVANMAEARQVARAIQVSEMSWWVAPAAVL
ncbi:4-diphosphocytidyl-2-C-methyl-D-erythritol kinase [Cognatiyoonia koreensis]|uniref:4-diphosphocytidyl-2-C-methyl-D-erythritol kinase n=1 Tax=Cognatiyoonia koreensis TaxID=364200 RepID=A0A1I0RGF2_9RHOB|nr:4-(cytidine 5'-diphospho)-2-C-methyl-D-erythritol kinase [Cognatiyoonia koreensis]SEW39761.1 4-diphosphocytidyl-2-C-methyl-D-erythritol kinase [Cognatiyoonia koreensis]